MVAVPMLRSAGLDQKSAHATSIAITMPLSVLSGILYLNAGSLMLADAMRFIPAGIAGAVAGALLLKRVPDALLRRIFGAVILLAAIRLLLR